MVNFEKMRLEMPIQLHSYWLKLISEFVYCQSIQLHTKFQGYLCEIGGVILYMVSFLPKMQNVDSNNRGSTLILAKMSKRFNILLS